MSLAKAWKPNNEEMSGVTESQKIFHIGREQADDEIRPLNKIESGLGML